MGKNQSKEQKEQIIIAQSGANASGVEARLSQFSITISVILVILAIIIAYFVCKKCHKRTKSWVQRQVMAITSQQREQGTITPSLPSVHSVPKVKILHFRARVGNVITMGKNQSKEQKEQIIIAQSGANASGVEARLSQFSITISVILVILAIIIAYFVCKKCHKRTKSWVQRQVMAITSQQREQGTITPSLPSVHSVPKVKIVSV
ncbi:unnamed protein product [Arctia plantaginis]|uniref:Uncharacterized protein n=1 Tax=Arctia plantaginis TaxID=874455 RepID=A0A8S1B459_ARCPL|nr:unnamed protein product [Arctia plantaginis]